MRLDRRCPECGLDAWLTVLHLIDPAASKLPRVRNPHRVGTGLVWLMLMAFLFMMTYSVQVMLIQLEGIHVVRWGGLSRQFMLDGPLLAVLFALAALWSPASFRPAGQLEADRPVVRPIRLLSWSISAMALVAVLYWICQRMQVAAGITLLDSDAVLLRSGFQALLALIGIASLRALNSVLDLIGQRSREYRQARGSRQSIPPMIAAAAGIIFGSLLRVLGETMEMFSAASRLGHVVSWVSMLMVLIGLAYLLVNSWWIRRALLAPPPVLERLVEPIQNRGEGGA